MPWLMGIDEAGYGPNLGPLLQTAVTLRVPDEGEPCLWKRLDRAVRRAAGKADGRLIVDDSKKVHEGPHGLRKLESGVLSLLGSRDNRPCQRLDQFLRPILTAASWDDLEEEDWFDPDEALPLYADQQELAAQTAQLNTAQKAQAITSGPAYARLVPAQRFNHLLDKHQLKSVILAEGVVEFCQKARLLPGTEPVLIAVDKLGGRNFYALLLQSAFPDGWVHTLGEGSALCRYQILGLEREIQIDFQPRADSAHMTVAIASMVSKYVREVCMMQFNRWWAKQVPGIKPTAGYPLDASRFMEAIRAKLLKMNIAEARVWRRK